MSTVFADRLRDRLAAAKVSVRASDLDLFGRYYALIERWNARINLTALPLIDYPAHTLDRLLVEPAVAANFIEPSATRWIDLGSGGGSPAVPLKILRPALALTMVEARERKCAFLREVVRQLGLEQAAVACTRFEDIDGLVQDGSVDIVTLRAVRVDEALSGLLARLLASDGSVMLLGGSGAEIPGFARLHRAVLPGGSSLLTFRRQA